MDRIRRLYLRLGWISTILGALTGAALVWDVCGGPWWLFGEKGEPAGILCFVLFTVQAAFCFKGAQEAGHGT